MVITLATQTLHDARPQPRLYGRDAGQVPRRDRGTAEGARYCSSHAWVKEEMDKTSGMVANATLRTALKKDALACGDAFKRRPS